MTQMKVSLERQGINVVQLGLELESEKAIKAYEVACRQLSHKVNIPGFRKGKAPRNIIEKTLGVDYIKREALERLVPELLSKVIVDENLDVITEPEIDECKFELGEPLMLQARLEVRPEVKLGQYQGVSVTVPEAAVPDDALDRALKSIAESKASLKEVDSRKVAMGDTVVLDFECHVDGKLVEGGKAEGLILEMKEGNFLDGFCEQLVGKEPGNKCEVNATFPKEYRNKELAGKEAHFKVNLKGIRERFIPDINDELAKAVGAESLEDLTNMLKSRMGEEIKQENDGRAQRAVVDAVITNAAVEIPDTMIAREHELLLNSLKQMVEGNGQTWEQFQQEPEYEQISGAKREEAKQRVLTSLVLGAIVRAEKMAVGEQEMAPYLAEMAARYNVQLERILGPGGENIRRQVMEELLTQKVVEYLVSHAEIRYVKDENPAESCAHHEHSHEHSEDCSHEHKKA
jgi:trigger factor